LDGEKILVGKSLRKYRLENPQNKYNIKKNIREKFCGQKLDGNGSESRIITGSDVSHVEPSAFACRVIVYFYILPEIT
jgi:hypothetical protein